MVHFDHLISGKELKREKTKNIEVSSIAVCLQRTIFPCRASKRNGD